MVSGLTERQLREIEYHAHHALALRNCRAFYEVLTRPKPKWWNHYWVSHSELLAHGITGKRLLVPGCGDGFDAIVCAKMGARVSAFDISPEMLRLAQERAREAEAEIEFAAMPAENLSYANDTFDVIYIRDVLHHCDIGPTLSQLQRVARPGAWIVIDELYTHSLLQGIRDSWLGRSLYRAVRPMLYGCAGYITPDERKLNESDLDCIARTLCVSRCQFFNVAVNRLVPAWDWAEMADLILTRMLPGRLVAGRFVLSGLTKA